MYFLFNHKINIFWNQHLIHHSSEEYNLACALRQSISNLISFGGIFLIPAAIVGVPTEIIMTLTPIHLFAQFWYHTQHIGKLGFLEYIIVTPSQHRVHHAINPIYIDKNLAAIFCVWDRIFGTYQEEDINMEIDYGITRQINSGSFVQVYFGEIIHLLKDVASAPGILNKLRYIFYPPGWSHQKNYMTAKMIRDQYLKSNIN